MRTVTLRNNFHETRVTLHVADDGELTKRQARRARRALCGMSDCSCGGNLGERGPQPGGVETEARPALYGNGYDYAIVFNDSEPAK